jgi:drug/metabolite transporter (DMT)-like permease
MLGVIFAAISACANAIKSIIHRHVMKTESVYSYALIFSLLTGLLFLPLALLVFELPRGITPWILFSLSAALWTIYSLVSFSSYKHTHVTIRETISQSRAILVQ